MSRVFSFPVTNEEMKIIFLLSIKLYIFLIREARGDVWVKEKSFAKWGQQEKEREKILPKGEHGSQAGCPQFFDSRSRSFKLSRVFM